MARQRLSQKNVLKLAQQLELPVVAVLVRGGTGHRRDLCLEDGSVVYLYRDGTTEVAVGLSHLYKPVTQSVNRLQPK